MAPPPAHRLPYRRLHAFARERLNPLVLRLGLAGGRRSPLSVVLHVGRRTGALYATPLLVHRAGAVLIVPLTYGAQTRWCLNVLTAGRCRVRRRGRLLETAEPRVVRGEALPARYRRLYRVTPIREFMMLRVAVGP